MRRLMKKITVWCLILFSLTMGIKEIYAAIPDKIYLNSDNESVTDKLNYGSFISISDTIEVTNGGSYTLECNLFNMIPIKEIQVYEAEKEQVGVGGNNIGIYMYYDGLMVIDTQSIETADGMSIAPAEGILEKGDYIKSVDGQQLENKEELVHHMENSQGETVSMCIERNGKEKKVSINPAYAVDGTYKLGVWVRDDLQGIGTLTYVKDDGAFGALGHGVSDMDSSELLEIKDGELYSAEILSIKKGVEGTPGELSGVIVYKDSEKLGTIHENTACGIFGTVSSECQEELDLEWYDISYKEDIYLGEAKIRCSTGEDIESYAIEIEEITMNSNEINKNFIFKVTDAELLEKTGGIVQGLSGSPIIQNGKIIGAVTHVLVNDPTRGYGIFIENMLDTAG